MTPFLASQLTRNSRCPSASSMHACMHACVSSPLALLFQLWPPTENITGRLVAAIREPPLEIVRHCGKILSSFSLRDRARDILEEPRTGTVFRCNWSIRARIRRNRKFSYASRDAMMEVIKFKEEISHSGDDVGLEEEEYFLGRRNY